MRGFGGGHRAIHAIAAGVLMLSRFATAAINAFPDYGSALGMFQALGLDAADPGGQFVSLSMDGGGEQQPLANIYQMPLSGKGWVWPGAKDQPARYLFLGGLGGTCRAPGTAPADGLPVATWRSTDADLAKEVAQLLRLLRGPAHDAADSEDSEEDGRQYAYRQIAQGDSSGAILLAAVHIYQAGLTNEANEIADRVFTLVQDRSAVVRHAVAHLAKCQYSAAGARLASSRDWRAYREDLQGLRDRFGQAWDKAPGLEVLIGKVDQQLAGAPPGGEGLDEAAARFFADISPDDVQLLNQLKLAVILNPAVQLALLSAPEDEAARSFFARGIHMVPPLLAVVDSDYLLPAALEVSSRYRSSSYSYSSRGEKALKSAEEIYKELENKPPGLGDTALELLKEFIPLPAQSMPEDGKSNTVQAARAFYEAHAADSPVELATRYLAEGNNNQISSALDILIQSKNSNVLSLVEARLFSSNIWSTSSYSVLDGAGVMRIHSYVARHPERARAVLPDFLAKLKEQLPDRLAKLDESRRKQEAQNVKQILAGLAQAGRPARGEEKAETASGEEEETPLLIRQRMGSSLAQRSEGMRPREIVALSLGEILAQKDAALRQSLLMTLLGLYQYCQRNAEQGREEKSRHPPAHALGELFDDALFLAPDYAAQVAARAREIREAAATRNAAEATGTNAVPPAGETGNPLLDFAAQWEVLLADERRPKKNQPEYFSRRGTSPKTTVADLAAYVVASIALDMRGLAPDRQLEIHSLGNRLFPYWRQVARAALDGTPTEALPPLPSAGTMEPKAVSRLAERISAAPPDERGPMVRGLDADSLLALAQAAAKDKALRAALAPAANRVDGIGEESATAFSPLLEPFVGAVLSTNLFDGLLQVARSLATQSVAATVTFQREPWLDGTTVSISTNRTGGASYGGYDPWRGSSDKDKARLLVQCQGQNTHGGAIWAVDLPAAKTNSAPPAAASPETDMQKILSQFGVTLDEADLSPEMLAQMAAAMAGARSSLDESGNQEQQELLLKTVDQFASGAKSPLTELQIAFQIFLPSREEDDENPELDMEFDSEEIIIP
ncbi:MAG: hypothetical protein EOM72_09365 [Opitutae bacterium]|nr:hypothetical protein [Opitutae bacterium]